MQIYANRFNAHTKILLCFDLKFNSILSGCRHNSGDIILNYCWIWG